ncbi:MAG TPA: porin family protein [Thermohalobaculum sp.]|nr:porin family protein [Thermohalobaculum sp.]
MEAGDASEAIQIFRRILARQPDLPRVRLELARAYFHARQWEHSRREFLAVLSGGVPDTVKLRIIQFLRAIDARRGFDWNLEAGFSTSPQSARHYDSDVVMIDFLGIPVPFEIDRNDDGDYGIKVRGAAEYRVEVPGLGGERVKILAFGSAFFSVFEGNGSGADDYLGGAEAGLRGAWPRVTATGAVAASMREYGGRHFEDRLELRAALEWRSPAGLSLFASGAAGILDDHISEFRDGQTARLRAGAAQSIGGRGQAGLALTGERLDADEGFESYTSLGAEVFGFTDLGLGIDASARVYLANQQFDERIPGFFAKADAWEYGADLDLTKTDVFVFGQFSPYVKLGLTRRDSDLDAFSYTETRIEAGLRKAF